MQIDQNFAKLKLCATDRPTLRQIQEALQETDKQYCSIEIEYVYESSLASLLTQYFKNNNIQELQQLVLLGVLIDDRTIAAFQGKLTTNAPLHLQELCLQECFKLTNKALKELLACTSLQALRSLNLSATSLKDSALKALARNTSAKSLNDLNISLCVKITDEALVELFQSEIGSKQLQFLYLQGLAITYASAQFLANPFLQKISLRRCRALNDEAFTAITNQCVNLKYLDLSQTNLGVQMGERITANQDLVSSLQHLKLYECQHIQLPPLIALIHDLSQSMSNLLILDLSWSNMNDKALQMLNTQKNHLQELSLCRCEKISLVGFNGFLSAVPENWRDLRTLLIGFTNIGEQQFSDIVQRCTLTEKSLNLCEIQAQFCCNLGRNYLQKIKQLWDENFTELNHILILNK